MPFSFKGRDCPWTRKYGKQSPAAMWEMWALIRETDLQCLHGKFGMGNSESEDYDLFHYLSLPCCLPGPALIRLHLLSFVYALAGMLSAFKSFVLF